MYSLLVQCIYRAHIQVAVKNVQFTASYTYTLTRLVHMYLNVRTVHDVKCIVYVC